MEVFILEYLYTERTIQFNNNHDMERRIEMFTKRSRLWERIEKIKSIDGIYLDYDDIKYYTLNLNNYESVSV